VSRSRGPTPTDTAVSAPHSSVCIGGCRDLATSRVSRCSSPERSIACPGQELRSYYRDSVWTMRHASS
jgi:hypothetical protein